PGSLARTLVAGTGFGGPRTARPAPALSAATTREPATASTGIRLAPLQAASKALTKAVDPGCWVALSGRPATGWKDVPIAPQIVPSTRTTNPPAQAARASSASRDTALESRGTVPKSACWATTRVQATV